MKVLTIDLKKGYRSGKFLLKFISLIILMVIVAKFSVWAYLKSSEYEEALSNVTERSTVIIDAGHGGEDCGAIGVSGVYEKDLNLEVAKALGEEFADRGYAVIYTRLDDRLLYTEEENIYGIRKISDLKNRCKIGAETPNAIFISIHMNSFSQPKYSGTHVYYSEKNEESYPLAMSVQSKIKADLQPDNNRVPKPGKNMYLLENLENPALLIECGFLTNPDECEKLSQKEYQKSLSFSIVCAIIEHIEKIKVKETENEGTKNYYCMPRMRHNKS